MIPPTPACNLCIEKVGQDFVIVSWLSCWTSTLYPATLRCNRRDRKECEVIAEEFARAGWFTKLRQGSPWLPPWGGIAALLLSE